MNYFSRSSLTKQISIASALVILATMTVLTTVINSTGHNAALKGAQEELAQRANSTQQMLEGYFESVNARAERQFNILEHWMGGEIRSDGSLVDTNGVTLPALWLGDQLVNGDRAYLERFKSLTGNEIAFLTVNNGQVHRAATLLQRDGKAMHGTEIPAGDPVSQALTNGRDYSGLTVRGGKYFFSKVKALKDGQGRVFAGLSLRISLDTELAQIRQLFGNIKVAQTGMIGILRIGGEGNGGAEWVLHPSLEGKGISDMQDNSTWAQATTSVVSSQPVVAEFPTSLINGQATDSLTATAMAPSWQWLAVATAPTEEFMLSATNTRNQIIIAGILATLICAAVMYWLLKNRLRPLGEVATALRSLGNGDLSAKVTNTLAGSNNEIHQIGASVNQTADQVRNLIKGIDAACAQIAQSSEGLVQQAKIARECSDQQFDASSNMSATVEEMHATVSQVADNAAEAASASKHVIEETNRGRDMVSGTITGMNNIAHQVEESSAVIQSLGESSQQILNIVNVIQDIAEKTNLLALNAAIEAARAGEQGRGFAVVADEVRKLAEQTSQSTSEISSTIGGIVRQTSDAVEKMSAVRASVSDGVDRANQAGSALDEIDTLIERSAVRASDIAHSTGEQQIATERFAEAVMKITELAQRNNSASESSEGAAREMIELSGRLKSALEKFKIA